MPTRVENFKIDIKICPQNPEKKDCVPACIKSVLDTCYDKNDINKEEICKLMETSKNRFGTTLGNLSNLNKVLLKKAIPYQFERPDKYEIHAIEIDTLLREASIGHPVICLVNRESLLDRDRGDYNSHAIILSGKVDDKLIYADPLILSATDNCLKTVTAHKFNVAWRNAYKEAIFIKKSEQMIL